MFVVAPYRTDAAIDHRPWGTVALVVANLAVAVLLGFPEEAPKSFWYFAEPVEEPTVNSWVLSWGEVDPLCWLSHFFVHIGWIHLVFNMFFLWAFGLVVEGAIGWRRFLPVYLGIGVLTGALIQLSKLGAEEGGAVGASAAIMGILAMAALWSPLNRVKTFVFFIGVIRIPWFRILWFASFFVGLDLLFLLLGGFEMLSETAHLLGAALGAAAGLVMLRRGWVDCAGWDVLSLHARGWRSPRIDPALLGYERPGEDGEEDPRLGALVRIRDAIDDHEPWAARDIYLEAQRRVPGWVLPPPDMMMLIRQSLQHGYKEEAFELMQEYVQAYPSGSQAVRLTLAREFLRAQRPAKALEQLDALSEDALTDAQRAARDDLYARARESRPPGALELE